MRKFFIGLICGVILGGLVLVALYRSPDKPETKNEALEILDDAIDEFATPTIEVPKLAGKSWKEELPDARVGFFPDTVRKLAKLVEQQYGVPCPVTLAQFALESRFGLSNLGASNYFGHCYEATKRFMEKPRYVVRYDWIQVDTQIVKRPIRFADYKDITEAFIAHGKYVSTSRYYKDAFEWKKNPEKFARALAVHYALDKKYATKLIMIMRRFKLARGL
jgi:flagellum-specific peptidoglycan hydrolase FlgJ